MPKKGFDVERSYQLYLAYRDGDADVFAELIESLVPFVDIVAKMKFGESYCLDDIRSAMLEKLVMVVQRTAVRDDHRAGFHGHLWTTLRNAGYAAIHEQAPQEFQLLLEPAAGKIANHRSTYRRRFLVEALRAVQADALSRIRFEGIDHEACRDLVHRNLTGAEIRDDTWGFRRCFAPARRRFLRDYAQVITRSSLYRIREREGVFDMDPEWQDEETCLS